MEEWESGDRSPALHVRKSKIAGGVCVWERHVILPHSNANINCPNQQQNIKVVVGWDKGRWVVKQGGDTWKTPNGSHGLDNPPLTLGIIPFSFNVAPS